MPSTWKRFSRLIARLIFITQGQFLMKIDLSGKTAIVTGSTAGIGYAIAKGLAQAGAEVVVNGRTAAAVE